MRSCERVQNELKAYLDGELTYPSSWSVGRHLAACESCRKELSEMKTLSSRLRVSDPGDLPAELRARILAAANQAGLPATVSGSGRNRIMVKPTLVWGT